MQTVKTVVKIIEIQLETCTDRLHDAARYAQLSTRLDKPSTVGEGGGGVSPRSVHA